LDSGVEVGWFNADEAYGDNPGLPAWLETRGPNYVMAVSCDSRFTAPTGPWRADELARVAPRKGWQRLSAGQGSKGDRLYDWLVLDPGADEHLLLVRRSISKRAVQRLRRHRRSGCVAGDLRPAHPPPGAPFFRKTSNVGKHQASHSGRPQQEHKPRGHYRRELLVPTTD
jgi:hypothetical protein